MAFDPNNVERFDITGDHGYVAEVGGYVLASDYDLLLALYTSESDARRLLATKLVISRNAFPENKLRLRWPLGLAKASTDDEIKGEPV
jgi:hypothetical protein